MAKAETEREKLARLIKLRERLSNATDAEAVRDVVIALVEVAIADMRHQYAGYGLEPN